MGLVTRFIARRYPKLKEYEFGIKLIVDMLFFAILIAILVNSRPIIVPYCEPIVNYTLNLTYNLSSPVT